MYVYAYAYARMYTCVRALAGCISVRVRACVRARVGVRGERASTMCDIMYMYVCMPLSMYVCMYERQYIYLFVRVHISTPF